MWLRRNMNASISCDHAVTASINSRRRLPSHDGHAVQPSHARPRRTYTGYVVKLLMGNTRCVSCKLHDLADRRTDGRLVSSQQRQYPTTSAANSIIANNSDCCSLAYVACRLLLSCGFIFDNDAIDYSTKRSMQNEVFQLFCHYQLCSVFFVNATKTMTKMTITF